jgi:hypothetical protein
MRPRWWVGVAVGVAVGLGAVAAVDAGTDDASAQSGFRASAEQLRINQRISQAAVRRSNQALDLLDPITRQPQIPNKVLGWRTQDLRDGVITSAKIANGSVSEADLASALAGRLPAWAVVGATGTLARSSGGITSTRLGEGSYRVDLNRNVGQCAWTATVVVSSAADIGHIAAAIDPVDSERLVVSTTDELDTASDRDFNLQVTC